VIIYHYFCINHLLGGLRLTSRCIEYWDDLFFKEEEEEEEEEDDDKE